MFAKVLEKGWVDSRSIHVFDTLLHMGGVYWFCNNLIKVLGYHVGARHVGRGHGRLQTQKRLQEHLSRPDSVLALAPQLSGWPRGSCGQLHGGSSTVLASRNCLWQQFWPETVVHEEWEGHAVRGPSPARPTAHLGAPEGDAQGAHAAGCGAALLHLLPGHAAGDPGPAGPHPAQPAHRLFQVAQPHGSPWHCTGQVGLFPEPAQLEDPIPPLHPPPRQSCSPVWAHPGSWANGAWSVGTRNSPLSPSDWSSFPGTLGQACCVVCTEFLLIPQGPGILSPKEETP